MPAAKATALPFTPRTGAGVSPGSTVPFNEPGSDTAQELVELVNVGGTSIDISGWTLSDATAVRHIERLIAEARSWLAAEGVVNPP